MHLARDSRIVAEMEVYACARARLGSISDISIFALQELPHALHFLDFRQSLINEDEFNPRDLLERFSRWLDFGENTSTGKCVGVGQNTLRTLGDFRRSGNLQAAKVGLRNDGNGSLMRLASVAFHADAPLEKLREVAHQQSKTTHASDIASECCQFLSELLRRLSEGQSYSDAKAKCTEHEWSPSLKSILKHDYLTVKPDEIKAEGNVIDTLQCALWAVENSKSFEEAVLKAVNLGDDADTVGAVTGQIAGARYGYSNIPHHLKARLSLERQLYVTSQFLN